MRQVLRNSNEVFHFWANQVQGSGSSGNVLFRGPNVYSYGMHFCIARILPSGTVAFTTRKYSVTTSSHVSAARQAARHMPAVYCNDPADSALQNMGHARNAIRDALANAEKKGIRQTTRDGYKAQALRLAENANAYLAALPEDERGNQEPINTEALEAVRAALEAADVASRRIAEEQAKARHADLLESLEQWRIHVIHTRTGLYSLPVALRLSTDGQTVETSHGADIPVSHARVLWPLVLRVKADGRGWDGQGRQLGAYRLTRIRADGSIVVGCHDIAFSELERIAELLGLSETVAG